MKEAKLYKLLILLAINILLIYSCNSQVNENDSSTFEATNTGILRHIENNEFFKVKKADTIHSKGISHVKWSNYNLAKKYFLIADSIEPNNPTILYSLGFVEMRMDNYEDSENY